MQTFIFALTPLCNKLQLVRKKAYPLPRIELRFALICFRQYINDIEISTAHFSPLRTTRTLFGFTYFLGACYFARYADISIIESLTLDLLTCRVPFDTYTITPQKHFLHWQDKEHNAYVGIDKECRNSLQITYLQHDFSASSLSDLVTATKSVGCGGMGTKVRVRSGEGIIMLNSRCNLQITNTLRILTCVRVCEYWCSRVWSLTVVNRGWGYTQKWV